MRVTTAATARTLAAWPRPPRTRPTTRRSWSSIARASRRSMTDSQSWRTTSRQPSMPTALRHGGRSESTASVDPPGPRCLGRRRAGSANPDRAATGSTPAERRDGLGSRALLRRGRCRPPARSHRRRRALRRRSQPPRGGACHHRQRLAAAPAMQVETITNRVSAEGAGIEPSTGERARASRHDPRPAGEAQ